MSLQVNHFVTLSFLAVLYSQGWNCAVTSKIASNIRHIGHVHVTILYS